MARILTLEAASAQCRGGLYDTEDHDTPSELLNFQGARWELARLSVDEVSDQLADLAVKIAEPGASEIQVIGIALSAPIDYFGVAILSQGPAVMVGDMINALRNSMQARFPQPVQVVLENRAQMAAWGEFKRGVGHGVHGGMGARSNLVYFHVGGGIGLGIVGNGQLYQGGSGYAGEFGHIVIDGTSPQICGTCGQNGCLVTLASGRSFVRDYLSRTNNAVSAAVRTEMAGTPQERVKFDAGYVQKLGTTTPTRSSTDVATEIDARAIVRAAEFVPGTTNPKDPDAHEVIKQAALPLAKAISYIAYILDPEVVVLGGIVSQSGLLKERLTQVVSRELIWFNRDTQLALSSLRDRADLVGAALWARDKYPSLTGNAP
jgi:predicted NBD/HSP70 family sugar kinase